MAKNKIEKTDAVDTSADQDQVAVDSGGSDSPQVAVAAGDPLFALYCARVSHAETVTTMRRDGRSIFRDAFVEAKVALDVYLEQTKEGAK